MIADVFLDHSTYAEPPSRLMVTKLFLILFFINEESICKFLLFTWLYSARTSLIKFA